MFTGLCILLAAMVVWIIVFFLTIKFSSVEVDPDYPFFEDEIKSEGIDNFKLKKNERV